jgi:1,4-dihydroxy-2-naphthoate polyprenyltransferase
MLSLKSDLPIFLRFRGALNAWLDSARPKTLIAGISPVLIGSSIASLEQAISWKILIFCLGFSLSLQLAVNWANDYFDIVKGTDTAHRKGPIRPVHCKTLQPKTMLHAALIALIAAAAFSWPLLARVGFVYWPIALLSMVCAILYTGGPHPLGYLGLGDILVFIFYGPIATAGSVLAQLHSIPAATWIAAIIPGSLACAMICVNNIRDVDEDLRARKMTLAARYGKKFGAVEYAVCLLAAMITPLLLIGQSMPTNLIAAWILIPFTGEPLQIVFQGRSDYNRALALTARLLFLYTLIFCVVIYAHLHF